MTSMGFGSGLEMERKGWGWHGEAGCGETGMQPRTDGGSNEEGRGGARMQKPHGSVCASGKMIGFHTFLGWKPGRRKGRRAEGRLL